MVRRRLDMIVSSSHSPQFTHRQDGFDIATVISRNNELVKHGTMNPWQRPQTTIFIAPLGPHSERISC